MNYAAPDYSQFICFEFGDFFFHDKIMVIAALFFSFLKSVLFPVIPYIQCPGRAEVMHSRQMGLLYFFGDYILFYCS